MSVEDGKPGASAAETIFLAALALPPPERSTYLAGACGDNEQLRQRVEALLRVHDAPEGFLPEQGNATPAGDPALTTFLAAQLTEQPGDTIGRYKLRQKIGEGGCGVVYLAEQEEPVRRKVALKVIKLGMDTRQVVARFEAERQALALMEHPNIARVIDAGATETGRPYFVMELVGGVKITDYCEKNHLDTRQRLDLFIQVCHAIQHAHQKGVIHRDIKPSNVLVAMQDGAPVPKVIDFGIAKAAQGKLTDQTVFTAFEQFIGTPAYMSPEQAQLGGLDVDTRSDIYSLGVLLYELLTGKTPFDSKELLAAGLDAMRRTIQEKEPLTPSTRLKQETAAQQVQGSGESKSQNQRSKIANDLDWIVMKCLEKERARRYETANGLARDIERHLNNEPVIARPPSRLYEFQKTVRRHKFGFAATAAVIVVLLLGIGGVFSEWRRAEQHATLERNERNLAESMLAQNQAIQLHRAEEYYEAGDRRNMLPYLAFVLRQNPTNRIAAERLFSTLSHRNWARLACPPMMHSNRVTSAMFSRDGKWVVTSAADGTAWVWDANTGQPVSGPLMHQAEINDAEFSPDGQLVVTASDDHTARVWNALTGQPVTDPIAHPERVELAHFSPDGQMFVTLCDDRAARLWNARTGRSILKPLRHGEGPSRGRFLRECDFSPDGTLLVTAARDEGVVRIWSCQTGETAYTLRHGQSDAYVRFSPDGRRVATACDNNTAMVWDLAARPPQPVSLTHHAGVSSIEFSPEGRRVVTASWDGTTQIWDAVSGARIGPPLYHGTRIRNAKFSPEGLRVVTASWDSTVRVWDAESGEPLTEPMRVEDGAFYAQFHPDGQRVLSASNGKSVLIWEIVGSPALTAYVPWPNGVLDFSPDGKRIVIASDGNNTCVRNLLTLEPLTPPFVLKPEIWVNQIVFSPDGKRIATGSDDGAARVWNSDNGQLLAGPMQHSGNVTSVSFSPDGKRLLSNSQSTLAVWDAQSGVRLFTIEHTVGSSVPPSFSPDGRKLLSVVEPATMRVWDAITGRPITPPLVHASAVASAQFSPDSRFVLTAGKDTSFFIWDAETGRKTMTSPMHRAAVQSATYTATGKRVLAATVDYGVQLWDLETVKSVAGEIRKHSGENRIANTFLCPDESRVAIQYYDETIQFWDALSGERLTEALAAPSSRGSRDGQWIASSIAGNRIRVWETPTAALPVPEWLAALAEALAGQRFNRQGLLEQVLPSELWALQERLKHSVDVDPNPAGPGLASKDSSAAGFYNRWARSFLAEPNRRTVLPSSPLTLAQHAQSLAQAHSFVEQSYAAGKEALLLEPTNVIAMGAVADTTTNTVLADWLSQRALELAPDSQSASASAPWVVREDILRKSRRFDEAIALLERYKPLWAKNPWIWGHRGESFQKLGRFEDAFESYSKAISVARVTDPKWPERDKAMYSEILNSLLTKRSRLLKVLNRPPEAATDFRPGTVAASSWCPASDFSATDNPNGPWSYGYSLAPGDQMTPYTDRINVSGLDIWMRNIAARAPPQVYHNPTTNTIVINNSIHVQPGGFGLHPGPGGEYSVARFTVPATGLYHVAGSFFGDDNGGGSPVSTTTDVHVLANGVSLLDGDVTGFGTGTGPSFDFKVMLNTRDQLDFAVGYGNNRDYGFDSTGLSVQIIARIPPAFVLQPASQTVPVGGNVTFDVGAAGTPPLSYQWRFSSTNLPGATNSNLTLAAVALSQSGTYAVVVSNSFGQALSSNALLTVSPP